ncbi:MAG: amino acid adenylation protein, partial [Opitutaceae bacterium]
GRAPRARVQAGARAAALLADAGGTYAVFAGLVPAALADWSPAVLLLLGPPLALAALTLQGVAAVACTGWLQRRFRADLAPGRIPVGGTAHARLWLLQRAARAIPWRLLEGTELQNAALRALGARIGEGVRLHHGVDLTRGGWEHLDLGDGVTVGRDAVLELARLEAGGIVLAGVTLEAGSTLETHAHVGGGARVGAGACLTARSALEPGAEVPAGERWDGVPAQPAGAAPPAPEVPPAALHPWVHAVLLVLARLALTAALWVPAELTLLATATAAGVDAAALGDWLAAPEYSPGLVGAGVGLILLAVPLWLLAAACACRLLGPPRPGVHSCWSGTAIRVSLQVSLVDDASRWLYGTLLWTRWLRLAGVKVGSGCEVSTLIDCVPGLTAIGDRTFCADGIYLGGPRLHRGTLTLAPVGLGADSFVGNGAVIPAGVRLPEGILLGVGTVAPAALPAGSSWFGHPPFALPRRAETRFDLRLTHRPGLGLRLVRVGWELLRFALPGVAALLLALWLPLVTHVVAVAPPLLAVALLLPLVNAGLLLLAPAAAAVALKWLLLGRVRPGAHPLWSAWASRWDFHCVAWNVLAGELAGWLDGTPWLASLLRAAGARIGRGTLLGGGFGDDLPDPDLLEIAEGAAVDGLFQAHTFEDRVLKMDHVRIAAGATIGRNAMLLYGSEIGAGARVAANSVVMKEERLRPGGRYAGVPTTLAPGAK